MSIDLKTISVDPKRQTFGHVARRLGGEKPASRYDEGMLDLQATHHFHYKPLWEPEYWVYDERKTEIKMADWYALRDPRQYYYATYNIARANMNQAVERNMAFVEKRNMLASLTPEWAEKVKHTLLPLRHVAWGANMNMSNICDRGYGTAVTAPCIFSAADQLGMAQLISRIGLVLDGNTGDSLDAAKATWMTAADWQDIRRMVEDSLVTKDWFEVFVAQNLGIDAVLHRLVFDAFDAEGNAHGAAGISMLTEFMRDWREEQDRWVDAVVKVAAAESAANNALLSGWASQWLNRALTAAAPLAATALGAGADAALADIAASQRDRCKKLGLTV